MSALQLARTAFFCVVASLLLAYSATVARAQSFVEFESGQVRPLAISPDGTRLFAVNTPDNRLEIYDIQAGTLVHRESVAVGLEPVAVAARSNGEVWVVNHLSDSVSIVDVSSSPAQVTRTLLVGDEPRDIVFADGSAGQRAWITTARRGQNSPVPPLLTTPGVGRALAWAFDPANLGSTMTGTPLAIVELFGDTPRALAVSPDGNTVYAAVFHSGNRTTAVAEDAVCDGGTAAGPCLVAGVAMPGGLPGPDTSADGTPRPEAGLIVKFDEASGQWRDELGRDWNNAVRFRLPDHDVFAISNTTLAPVRQVAGVGTINFNMAVNPASGKLYVTNTEAFNEVRFEGPGTFVSAGGFKPPGEPASVIGHQHEARISVIDTAGNVAPRRLNKHIDYSVVPSPPGTIEKSLATPLGMAVSSDGQTLYVAAFGSQKVGVLDTAALEDDSFVPSASGHIALSGGGPTGVVLDEANRRLYVATRFDNGISVVDTASRSEVAHLAMFNPEPAHVVDGRPVLYDARTTSSNGEASCSSCHVFGDVDSLAWDLGNPDGDVTVNNLQVVDPVVDGDAKDFHPMKGPMVTQTLRGMRNHGAMHWRGDRSVGFFGSDPLDSELSFNNFIVAFEGLLGHDGLISEADMQRFTAFILDVAEPPNPIRPLDNHLAGDALDGSNIFPRPGSDLGLLKCNQCHVLAPSAGFFGANGRRSSVNEPQQFKVPHLRNLYTKVGMFGMPEIPFLLAGDNGDKGDQVRGFGMLHDGSVDTIERFFGATMFRLTQQDREQLEQFMFAFPSDYAPIVGQQVTLDAGNAAAVGERIDLMIDRAKVCFVLKDQPDATECDLVVKGSSGGEARGWLGRLQGPCEEDPVLLFQGDRESDPLLTDAQLRALAAGSDRLTFTCVPPGSGARIALDRDEDGHFDRDELDAGSDPASAASVPTTAPLPFVLAQASRISIKDTLANAEPRRSITIGSRDPAIAVPAPGSAGDPRCNGDPAGTVKVSLTVSSAASGQVHRTALPCQGWSLVGSTASPKGWRYQDRALLSGTVQGAQWRSGKLSLSLRGKGAFFLNYDLATGAGQDAVDVVLAGKQSDLCLSCPPADGQDGSDGESFYGKACAAPAACGRK